MGTSEAAERAELGARVAEGRQRAGLTQTELGQRSGIERTAISKIEAGARKLSATELVTLAAVLDVPVDWFFTPSPPSVVSRRSDAAVGGHSQALDARVERIAREVEALTKAGVLTQHERLELEVPRDLVEAEDRASRTRQWVGAGSEPLLELQAVAERLGLLAFSLALGPTGGDAAYVALDGSGVAVLNGFVDPGRRRFNLAHELGHHVFGDAYAPEVGLSPQDETEKLINAYAINLLLPRSGVAQVWRELGDDPRLAATALAVRFRVSWTAVCAQLRNLGHVDGGLFEELTGNALGKADFVELGEHWVAEMEPPSVPPEYGRRVLDAYRRGKFTVERTVELLWGTLRVEDLPEQVVVPIESLRPEFNQLP